MWLLFTDDDDGCGDVYVGCTNDFSTVRRMIVMGTLPDAFLEHYAPDELSLYGPHKRTKPVAHFALEAVPDAFAVKPPKIPLPVTDDGLVNFVGEEGDLQEILGLYLVRRRRSEESAQRIARDQDRAASIANRIQPLLGNSIHNHVVYKVIHTLITENVPIQ